MSETHERAPMSAIPKRAIPKRETTASGGRDHQHVGRISTQTTIFVLIAVAPILYEIQWIPSMRWQVSDNPPRALRAHDNNVRKSTKLSPQLAVFRWGARTATWKPASNTFTPGTLGNSRGWKRWSLHWMIACGSAMV